MEQISVILKDNIIILSVIVILCIMAITSLINKIVDSIRDKHILYVKENSKLFIELSHLNSKFTFNQLNDIYIFTEYHQNKQKFDRDTSKKFMSRHIYENTTYYEDIIEEAKYNKNRYSEYEKEYEKLDNNSGNYTLEDNKIYTDKFLKTEKELYIEYKIDEPITSIKAEYKLNYTSPKGRNNYKKSFVFLQNTIEEEIQKVYEEKSEKETRQYTIKLERSRLTSGLRFDILKRDGYSCQICGSSASDGVKLHIDHKIPVSKGGLTQKDNLWVLCDRCNLGKSNKQ